MIFSEKSIFPLVFFLNFATNNEFHEVFFSPFYAVVSSNDSLEGKKLEVKRTRALLDEYKNNYLINYKYTRIHNGFFYRLALKWVMENITDREIRHFCLYLLHDILSQTRNLIEIDKYDVFERALFYLRLEKDSIVRKEIMKIISLFCKNIFSIKKAKELLGIIKLILFFMMFLKECLHFDEYSNFLSNSYENYEINHGNKLSIPNKDVESFEEILPDLILMIRDLTKSEGNSGFSQMFDFNGENRYI